MIKAVEQGTDTLLATVYREISLSGAFTPSTSNDPKSQEGLAALANYKLAVVGPFSPTGTQTYNGVNDIVVTFYYTRIQRNIIVEAWDSQSGEKIGGLAAAQFSAGQAHTISAPTAAEISALSSYELNTVISASAQSIYAESTAATDITVKFWYKPNVSGASTGTVTVSAYWMDSGVKKPAPEFQSYTVPYPLGMAFTVTPPAIHGWAYNGLAGDSQTVTPTVAQPNQTIEFEYKKNVWNITVVLWDSSKVDTQITDASLIQPGYILEIAVAKGDTITVAAPYITGFIWADGETGTRTGTPAEDIEISFYYQPYDSIFVTHTLIGQIWEHDEDTGSWKFPATAIYTYELQVRRDPDPDSKTFYPAAGLVQIPGYLLGATSADGFYLSNYSNDSHTISYMPMTSLLVLYETGGITPVQVFDVTGQDAKLSVVPDADKTVTFVYNTLATTVTINMVNENTGNAVAEAFTVAATTGEAFSYTAPYVPSFSLTGQSVKTINSVQAGGVSEISNMTRAEVAQMFYNLLADKSAGGISKSFSDVQSGSWHYTAVTVLASHGIIDGYADGTIQPGRIYHPRRVREDS